jgi:hypothetical protein
VGRKKRRANENRAPGSLISGAEKTEGREVAMDMSLKRIRAALKKLAERGVIVDSGERCPQTGEVCWMVNPELTEEQRQALLDMPDLLQ